MPKLRPSKKFLSDAESFRPDAVLRKKIAKALSLLQATPLHPGLRLERIVNDLSACSVRIDDRYRLSLDPGASLNGGNPDWSAPLLLLRVLDHDALYRKPR